MCSFSSVRAITLLLSQVIIMSLCFQIAAAQTDTNAETSAPENTEETLPKPANTLPPAIPDRNVPAPPAISHISTSGQMKQPLAWRQKALTISSDKFKSNVNALPANQRVVAGSYSDVIVSLAETCSSFSYKSEQLNSSAGELLVSNGKVRMLFCVWEQEPSKTVIAACVDRGKTSETQKILTQILDATFNTFAHRGRI